MGGNRSENKPVQEIKELMMLAMMTIGKIGIFLGVLIVIIVVIAAISGESEEAKKKRLVALPGQISDAHSKALKAATRCMEMQKAAILAEALLSAAGFGDKQWKSTDGPRAKDLVAKTRAASIKALVDLKRLSVEAVVSSSTSYAYANLRTYCLLAYAACECCDAQLCHGNCQALDILKKIQLN